MPGHAFPDVRQGAGVEQHRPSPGRRMCAQLHHAKRPAHHSTGLVLLQGFLPAAHMQLLVYAVDVGLHGADGQPLPMRDLLVQQALGEQVEDIVLPRGAPSAGSVRAPYGAGHIPPIGGQRWRSSVPPPLRQLADGLQQGDRGGILEHVSIGTGLQGLEHAQVIIMHGEDHELYVGQEGAQLPQQLDAVGAGQADIAYHHVQIQLRDGREGLLRASLGVQELHIFSTTQEPFQMDAHLHEILHHGDADRHSHGSKADRFSGDGACTRTLLYSASGQGPGPLAGSPWHDQFQPGTLPRL